jgi:hypothetical protein
MLYSELCFHQHANYVSSQVLMLLRVQWQYTVVKKQFIFTEPLAV